MKEKEVGEGGGRDETLATNATPSLPLVRSTITLEITLLAEYNGKFDSRRANTATPAELPDSVLLEIRVIYNLQITLAAPCTHNSRTVILFRSVQLSND